MANNTATPEFISARRFSFNDQNRFATLSGDTNPIHVDPIAARRTMAGQCIVHGMHSLLWALDALVMKKNISAKELKVRFLKPIFLDEDIQCVWNDETKKITLQADDTVLVVISLVPGQITTEQDVLATIERPRNEPAELSFADCSKFSSKPLILHGDPTPTLDLFPFACRKYGLATICEIAELSYFVGMECPGLNSLFAALKVKFNHNENLIANFSVASSDARFNSLNIIFQGHTLSGEIQAFYRPSPVRIPTMAEISAYVHIDEFINVCALILGGSRGLGELVAKLIAAGGGEPIITYNVGKVEAEQLIEDIHGFGGHCRAFQFTMSGSVSLPVDLPKFNQLYYFATPKILGKRTARFDDALYKEFLEIYVDGFKSVCNQIITRGNTCSVLYPSTIFIDHPSPKFANYSMAKAQGEILCQEFNSKNLLRILTPRLPRMATDQTQSLLRDNLDNPVEVMLPFVREMVNK